MHEGGVNEALRREVQFGRKERIAGMRARGQNRSMHTNTTTAQAHSAADAGARHISSDASRWSAVGSRDRTSDGSFVYAVSSTGVYCRPSCPSRRPRRDRVSFFDTPHEARAAGFRACKRCRPDSTAPAIDPWIDRVRRACVYLANVEGHPSLAMLARRLGGSPYHLQRNFKRLAGVTPREYADACRLRKVKRHLRDGTDVTGAMLDAGYGSASRFYERAVPKLGMAPTEYRRGGAGLRVRFAIVDSPNAALGRLLVAATDRGVCAVAMAASDGDLMERLAHEYPAATVIADPGALADWTRAIVAHLAGRQPRLELPLAVQATAFQWRVWQALAAIPYGETRTYSDVATAIGRPRAVRAVARACASNPVALAIPCHRVVPAAGGVGGYRWGAERKQALLARERQTGRPTDHH
jgi:AraC family transcriptional regulator of adaptative response/methylated-DNA-[protein]-cysteine methyltransferase